MNTNCFGFDQPPYGEEYATHPLARPLWRLALSLLLAGTSLRRRLVPDTRPHAPPRVSNYHF